MLPSAGRPWKTCLAAMYNTKHKYWLYAAFGLYAGVMLWLLLGRSSMDTGEDYWLQVSRNISWQPLRTVRHQLGLLGSRQSWVARFAARNLAGNVVLFVPLGLMLGLVWPKLKGLWPTLAACAGIIVSVELTQLLTLRGVADTDDLLLNLLGCALGCGLQKWLWAKKSNS